MDAIIPIVFPEYKILVDLKPVEVDIFPALEFDDFVIPGYQNRFSDLGHSGVLFINGVTGMTKYYEYGRYDSAGLGLVRRIPIPDANVKEGSIDSASLKPVLAKISRVAGQGGRISAVYIEVEGKFSTLLNYAETRKRQNANSKREPYNIITNSCIHFVKKITKLAGVDTPWMIDPRPNSYIGKFRDDFPDLDYDYTRKKLIIEGRGEF